MKYMINHIIDQARNPVQEIATQKSPLKMAFVTENVFDEIKHGVHTWSPSKPKL